MKYFKTLIITFFIAAVCFLISWISFYFQIDNLIGNLLSYPMAFVFGAGYGGGDVAMYKMSIAIFLTLWVSVFCIYYLARKVSAE